MYPHRLQVSNEALMYYAPRSVRSLDLFALLMPLLFPRRSLQSNIAPFPDRNRFSPKFGVYIVYI